MGLSHRELVERLRLLSGPERDVLALRCGLTGRPKSIAATAAVLGLTPRKVQKIEAIACAKLRHPSTGGRSGNHAA